MSTTIHGTVAPGFEAVRAAFQANFEHQGEVGARCTVYVEGRPVADLWGGTADVSTGRPYDDRTLQLLFSTTKGAAAACAHLLVQRDHLDLDAPVVRYWPEFGQAGKDEVPVRWLLSHQVGLPYVDEELTLDEVLAWDPIVRALEAQAPAWEPGTAHGYHACTFGWLVGELIRRVDGRRIGRFLADEVVAPLELELWIGLPDAEQARVAPLVGRVLGDPPEDPGVRELWERFIGPGTTFAKTLMIGDGAFGAPDVWDRPEVRAAEIPAGNGVGTAHAVARMYAGLVGTVEGGPDAPLLTPEQVAVARQPQATGRDAVLGVETSIALGFWPAHDALPYRRAPAFGHTGAGGSVGFADPEHGIGFGYAMNRLLPGDPRARHLVDATYRSMGLDPHPGSGGH